MFFPHDPKCSKRYSRTRGNKKLPDFGEIMRLYRAAVLCRPFAFSCPTPKLPGSVNNNRSNIQNDTIVQCRFVGVVNGLARECVFCFLFLSFSTCIGIIGASHTQPRTTARKAQNKSGTTRLTSFRLLRYGSFSWPSNNTSSRVAADLIRPSCDVLPSHQGLLTLTLLSCNPFPRPKSAARPPMLSSRQAGAVGAVGLLRTSWHSRSPSARAAASHLPPRLPVRNPPLPPASALLESAECPENAECACGEGGGVDDVDARANPRRNTSSSSPPSSSSLPQPRSRGGVDNDREKGDDAAAIARSLKSSRPTASPSAGVTPEEGDEHGGGREDREAGTDPSSLGVGGDEMPGTHCAVPAGVDSSRGFASRADTERPGEEERIVERAPHALRCSRRRVAGAGASLPPPPLLALRPLLPPPAPADSIDRSCSSSPLAPGPASSLLTGLAPEEVDSAEAVLPRAWPLPTTP